MVLEMEWQEATEKKGATSLEEEEPEPAEEYQDPQGDREREKEHADHKTRRKKNAQTKK